MVESRVGLVRAARLVPLNQVEQGGALTLADLHQHAAITPGGEAEPLGDFGVAALAHVADYLESEHLVEGQRALEVGAIDVKVKDSLYPFDWFGVHDVFLACYPSPYVPALTSPPV